MNNFNLKTERAFTSLRKYGYLYTLAVAFGGLYFPKLGLSVIVVMLGLILFAFFKGRYWCGNVCAHGSLYDSLILPLSRNKKIPKLFKTKTFSALFFAWFMYNWGGGMLNALIHFEANTEEFWDAVGGVFVATYLSVTVLGGLTGITFAPRTWCQFCPMSSMQSVSYKLGKKTDITKYTDEKVTILDKQMCHKCGKCERVCPMQLSPYTEFTDNNQLDNPNCIRCSTCVENCPAGILSLSTERSAKFMQENVIARFAPDTGTQMRQRVEAKISKVTHLSEDTREFTFEFTNVARLEYKAGQFILVRIQSEPEEMFRAYSISAYDPDKQSVTITVKKAPNGYGTGIIYDQFEVGTETVLEGPLGHELVINPTEEKVLMIGAGVGITPFRALSQEMALRSSQQNVTLLYGARTADQLLFRDEFEQIEANNSRFKFVPVISNDETWDGEKGRVTGYMSKIEDIKEHRVYMCGSKAMIESSKKELIKLGVPKENIFAESA